MQVPQELACLNSLVELDLRDNAPPLLFADGSRSRGLVPKMPVTEHACRFLLNLPAILAVHVSLTQEEEAALFNLSAELCRARDGHHVLRVQPSENLVKSWWSYDRPHAEMQI